MKRERKRIEDKAKWKKKMEETTEGRMKKIKRLRKKKSGAGIV